MLALLGGWAFGTAKSQLNRGWTAALALLAILNVAPYWMFIPYRSQQRFMLQALGLAAVPLALLLDRWRWLSFLAAVLLAMHLLSPESWPFAGSDGSIPWDLSVQVPNDIGAPIPLFPRLAHAWRPDRNEGSYLSLAALFGILVTSTLMSWAWCRNVFRPGRDGWRLAIALAATVVFLVLGYQDVWLDGRPDRVVSYPPFADFFTGWQRMEMASGPTGSRVAYAGTNIPYYLFGKNLRNRVRYVNINDRRDWLLHDYYREAQRAVRNLAEPEARLGPHDVRLRGLAGKS